MQIVQLSFLENVSWTKSGPAKAGPAGPLATALLKHLQGVQEPQAKEVEEVEEEENGQWLSIMVADRGNTRGYNHILGWGRIIIGVREYTTPGGKSVGIIHARTLGKRFFILGLGA